MALNPKEKNKSLSGGRIFLYVVIALILAVMVFFMSGVRHYKFYKFPIPNISGRFPFFFPTLPFSFMIFVILLVYLIVLDYVYHDAKKRGMSPWLWVIIVIFVPYLLGFVVYLLVRTAPPEEKNVCPECGADLKREYAFCPKCGKSLKMSCPKCKKPVEIDQKFCPYCGHELK